MFNFAAKNGSLKIKCNPWSTIFYASISKSARKIQKTEFKKKLHILEEKENFWKNETFVKTNNFLAFWILCHITKQFVSSFYPLYLLY